MTVCVCGGRGREGVCVSAVGVTDCGLEKGGCVGFV